MCTANVQKYSRGALKILTLALGLLSCVSLSASSTAPISQQISVTYILKRFKESTPGERRRYIGCLSEEQRDYLWKHARKQERELIFPYWPTEEKWIYFSTLSAKGVYAYFCSISEEERILVLNFLTDRENLDLFAVMSAEMQEKYFEKMPKAIQVDCWNALHSKKSKARFKEQVEKFLQEELDSKKDLSRAV